jgi:hypothetical protein
MNIRELITSSNRIAFKRLQRRYGYNFTLNLSRLFSNQSKIAIRGTLSDADLNNAVSSFAYNNRSPTVLCELMQKFGSDKARRAHNYAAFYHQLFLKEKETIRYIFEMGIGTNNPKLVSSMGINGKPGASLRGWQEFFPNANVFAADIDDKILFNDERISTFHCDQTSPISIAKLWASEKLKSIEFDILIDDGLHTIEGGTILLQNSLHKVKENGFYVIEDLKNDDLERWVQYLSTSSQLLGKCRFAILQLPHPWNRNDNTLIIIKKLSS